LRKHAEPTSGPRHHVQIKDDGSTYDTTWTASRTDDGRLKDRPPKTNYLSGPYLIIYWIVFFLYYIFPPREYYGGTKKKITLGYDYMDLII